MSVHYSFDRKAQIDKADNYPHGGKLPEKPVTARGLRRNEKKV